MEGRGRLKFIRSGRHGNTMRAIGLSLVVAAGGLALLLWMGDRLATVLIDAMVKAVLWGMGFGWLKMTGL